MNELLTRIVGPQRCAQLLAQVAVPPQLAGTDQGQRSRAEALRRPLKDTVGWFLKDTVERSRSGRVRQTALRADPVVRRFRDAGGGRGLSDHRHDLRGRAGSHCGSVLRARHKGVHEAAELVRQLGNPNVATRIGYASVLPVALLLVL